MRNPTPEPGPTSDETAEPSVADGKAVLAERARRLSAAGGFPFGTLECARELSAHGICENARYADNHPTPLQVVHLYSDERYPFVVGSLAWAALCAPCLEQVAADGTSVLVDRAE